MTTVFYQFHDVLTACRCHVQPWHEVHWYRQRGQLGRVAEPHCWLRSRNSLRARDSPPPSVHSAVSDHILKSVSSERKPQLQVGWHWLPWLISVCFCNIKPCTWWRDQTGQWNGAEAFSAAGCRVRYSCAFQTALPLFFWFNKLIVRCVFKHMFINPLKML